MKITTQTLIELDTLIVTLNENNIQLMRNIFGGLGCFTISKIELRQIVDFLNGKQILDKVIIENNNMIKKRKGKC